MTKEERKIRKAKVLRVAQMLAWNDNTSLGNYREIKPDKVYMQRAEYIIHELELFF